MRGIVTLPGLRLTPPATVSSTGLDPSLVRLWCLYWDRIAEPEQVLIGFGEIPDLEFLRSEGIFSKVPVPRSNGEFVSILAEARFKAYEALEHESPGQWAIASSPDDWDGEASREQRSLRVALMSAIPVPDGDVPLADILEFRERRRDEREALMLHIDKVYQSAMAAPDRPLAEHSAMKALAQGVADQLKAVQESSFRFRLADIAADFNLVGAGVAAAGTIALGANWPAVVGNSLAAGASVTVSKIIGLARPIKTGSPYRYVTSLHEEVFGNF